MKISYCGSDDSIAEMIKWCESNISNDARTVSSSIDRGAEGWRVEHTAIAGQFRRSRITIDDSSKADAFTKKFMFDLIAGTEQDQDLVSGAFLPRFSFNGQVFIDSLSGIHYKFNGRIWVII